MSDLIEIRWHARGGQGAVTASKLLAEAALEEGKYFQGMPDYGAERMGAPIRAFTRISSEPIVPYCQVTEPDVVVVLDPSLMDKVDVTSGLKKGGPVIINTRKTAKEIKKEFGIKNPVATVNATKIARDVLGVPIVNTTVLGAVIKLTGVVKKESAHTPLEKRFGRLGERNIQAMETAYKEVAEVQ